MNEKQRIDAYKLTREADEAVAAAIAQRIQAAHVGVEEALKSLVNYEPEAKPLLSAKAIEYYGEPEEGCPLFTESYLYPLLGKEDARTVLAMLGSVARAIGYEEGWWGVQRKYLAEEDEAEE